MAFPCIDARLFAVSDIHTDHGTNKSWVDSVHPTRYQSDALIVAGDVANDLSTVEKALKGLTSKFERVFFVPGNHDLWVSGGSASAATTTDSARAVASPAETSLTRLRELDRMCRRLGVETGPAAVGGRVLVCPLLSWYERTTDPAHPPEGYKEEHLQGWMDFWKCNWDGVDGRGNTLGKSVSDKLAEAHAVTAYMLHQNEERLARLSALRASQPLPIVTFSHFVPRRDLMPSVQRLKFKELLDVAVCEHLDEQVREAGADVHVFGHTHIPCNRLVDGVRYIQQPLGYPGEPWIRPDQKEVARMQVWPPLGV
eukprot:m.11861 g.11861  ORF g.11861 m.11861 type:complete len:312 (-) comp2884_c0_seq1:382-1317(-)